MSHKSTNTRFNKILIHGVLFTNFQERHKLRKLLEKHPEERTDNDIKVVSPFLIEHVTVEIQTYI